MHYWARWSSSCFLAKAHCRKAAEGTRQVARGRGTACWMAVGSAHAQTQMLPADLFRAWLLQRIWVASKGRHATIALRMDCTVWISSLFIHRCFKQKRWDRSVPCIVFQPNWFSCLHVKVLSDIRGLKNHTNAGFSTCTVVCIALCIN